MTDHPREYGENVRIALKLDDAGGSSPRIRGECGGADQRPATGGIIPANTGRMRTPQMCPHMGWDHPREYGENPHRRTSTTSPSGSSPRIRGESTPSWFRSRGCGIIPANTGRMVSSWMCKCLRWDHPREYGENSPCPTRLSPLMGIIPANTGRIEASILERNGMGDHPREYGENESTDYGALSIPGSSPRIRGECGGSAGPRGRGRIIPANTGRILADLRKPDQQD